MKNFISIFFLLVFSVGCVQKNSIAKSEKESPKEEQVIHIKSNVAETNQTQQVQSQPKQAVIEHNQTSIKISDQRLDNNGTSAPLNQQKFLEAQNEVLLKSLYFDIDRYDIKDEQKEIVKTNAKFLLDQKTRVRLEGNCDELGSGEYNFALGLKRANSVKMHLIQNGMQEDEIDMITLGETNPVCKSHTPECFAQNRRVDFMQVSK